MICSARPFGKPASMPASCALTSSAVSRALAPGTREIAITTEGWPSSWPVIVVVARTELDARDVAQADEGAVGLRAHDDGGELLDVDQAAAHAQRVLEALARRGRWLADLARRGLHVLLADRARDVGGGELQAGHAVGPQPDPHAELGAEHAHVADALDALQLVDDVDVGVVDDEEPVVGVVRANAQREYISVSGDCLRTVTPWAITSCGSCACAWETRFCTSTAARSGSRSSAKVTVEVRAAVVAAHGVDVEHVGDAVDLLVERHGHRFLDDVGAGAEVARVDLHRRQRDLRELRDRQLDQRQRSHQQQEQRDDDREDRPVDEEPRHADAPGQRPAAAGVAAAGVVLAARTA